MNTITRLGCCMLLICSLTSKAQDPWIIKADKIDPSNYYGITVGNGMIGIVSAPMPFQISSVVLAGAYDMYGRGRVSNFLNSFNLLNMNMQFDGDDWDPKKVSNFTQELDMQHASFTASFDYGDVASVKYTYYALRQLPFCCFYGCIGKRKKSGKYYSGQHYAGARCFKRGSKLLQ